MTLEGFGRSWGQDVLAFEEWRKEPALPTGIVWAHRLDHTPESAAGTVACEIELAIERRRHHRGERASAVEWARRLLDYEFRHAHSVQQELLERRLDARQQQWMAIVWAEERLRRALWSAERWLIDHATVITEERWEEAHKTVPETIGSIYFKSYRLAFPA